MPSQRFVGQLLYPAQPRTPSDTVGGAESLGLVEDNAQDGEDQLDPALEVAINPRFGLVAVGTKRYVHLLKVADTDIDTFSGLVQLVSVPPYPRRPVHSHSFDLKHSGNLRGGPGKVQSLTWSADGYCLAVGYENGWAAWSMGGRLGGWGVKVDDDDTEVQEAFMTGVSQLVRPRIRPIEPTTLMMPVLGSREYGTICSVRCEARPGPKALLHPIRQERNH